MSGERSDVGEPQTCQNKGCLLSITLVMIQTGKFFYMETSVLHQNRDKHDSCDLGGEQKDKVTASLVGKNSHSIFCGRKERL